MAGGVLQKSTRVLFVLPHQILQARDKPPGRRIILYDYIPSRTRETLKQLLIRPEGAYRGKLLTDGLDDYDEIC
jgi:hypothetical protein